MTEKYQPIPHRLKNMAVGGHVAGAVDILDDLKDKDQQTINAEQDLTNQQTAIDIDDLNEDFENLEDLVNEKQMEIGATEFDVRPKSGSTHPVTSGGIYTHNIEAEIVVGDPQNDWQPATAEAMFERCQEAISRLNGNDVIPVADHTAVVSPVIDKIYREQGETTYTDWMYYDNTWYEIATYEFPGIDDEPTLGSSNLVKSGGIKNNIASAANNGNIAYSALRNDYVSVGAVWEPKVLKTLELSVGDTITDESFEVNGSGMHYIFDAYKYNNNNLELLGIKYKLQGSASYHVFVLLDEDYKVVYVSSDVGSSGAYVQADAFGYNNYRYIVFNNFLNYQANPDIVISVSSKANRQIADLGDAAYSVVSNEYVSVKGWEIGLLNTSELSVGDVVSDDTYVKYYTGKHLVVDVSKYNTTNTVLKKIRYKIQGSASHHLFVLLDEDYKVVYISNSTSTAGDYTEQVNPWSSYTYKYIILQNIYQANPDVGVYVEDKTSVRAVEQSFTDVQKSQVNKNLGLYSTENEAALEVYQGSLIDIETGEVVESTVNAFMVREYAIKEGYDYLASGRKANTSERCSIAYYDSNFEYIGHDKDGGGSAANFEDYALVLPEGTAFVRIAGRRGSGYTSPTLKTVVYFKDINFDAIGEDSSINKLKGKTIAIIGASVDTHGNSGPNRNAVEMTITEEDVGVELSAYVTYHDVEGGLSLGGTTFTNNDIGTEVTFTPAAEDVGKSIGKPRNYNSNSMKVWWQYIQDYFDCNIIPVCWSGSGYTRNRQGESNQYYTSHAWHDATIRKCGIRTPGTMTRTAPDVIIISRTLNDFTHSPYARITEGYFDKIDWQYPDSDIRQDGNYGLLEGISVTIKKLRETYPFTPIVLMDSFPCKRLTSYHNGHFPMNNGLNNQPQLNKAFRDAADFFGCQFIPRSKCAITWENMYPTYIDDSPTIPTHPNEKGHEVLGKFAVDYLKLMNFTV